MASWLQTQWYRLSLWHLLLIPVSWLFRLLSGLRRLAYQFGLFKSYRLGVPVIIVGNISVGGTGKTPLVIWLAEQLQKTGFSPAVISRGYAGQEDLVAEVSQHSAAAMVGDEPLLIEKRLTCPVWVGRDRVLVGKTLLQAHQECDVIISDDGLQHYRLQRDVEIAVVDGERGFGNGQLLPAGPLREPVSRLEQVDAVIYNGGSTSREYAMQLEATLFHNVQDPAQTISAQSLSGANIYALAGIGNPQRFFNQLSGMGLRFRQQAFADHHAFSPADLQIDDAEVILMTEKDAVKCAAFARPNWWYLPVHAVVDEALLTRILHKLRK